MKKIKLKVAGIAPIHSINEKQSSNYTIIMDEIGTNKRRLPIVIGSLEAQSIAIAIEGIVTARPITHDLLKSILISYNINVTEVIIYNFVDGIFFAKLICNNGDISHEIDARTSDAIAIAIRMKCPIYTYNFIFDKAGIDSFDDNNENHEKNSDENTEDEKEEAKNETESNLSGMTIDELEEKLKVCLDYEDYELAAKLRDELNKRKK